MQATITFKCSPEGWEERGSPAAGIAARFLVLLWVILLNLGEVLLETELHYVARTLGRWRRAGSGFSQCTWRRSGKSNLVEGVPAHGMGLGLGDL